MKPVNELEPKVAELYRTACNIRESGGGPISLLHKVFYKSFKPKIMNLVGWYRGRDLMPKRPKSPDGIYKPSDFTDEVLDIYHCADNVSEEEAYLRSSEAYMATYNAIYQGLTGIRIGKTFPHLRTMELNAETNTQSVG